MGYPISYFQHWLPNTGFPNRIINIESPISPDFQYGYDVRAPLTGRAPRNNQTIKSGKWDAGRKGSQGGPGNNQKGLQNNQKMDPEQSQII